MDENLRDFMSKDEQAQMDALIHRALQRQERRKEAAVGSKRFQFYKCQCEVSTEMEERGDAGRKEDYFDIQKLLMEICGYCLKNGMCQCNCHKEAGNKNEYPDTTDEELPF